MPSDGPDRIVNAVWARVAGADLQDLATFVTVRDVAKKAHVASGTVTHHFPERTELIQESFNRALADFAEHSNYADLVASLDDVGQGRAGLEVLARAIEEQVRRIAPGTVEFEQASAKEQSVSRNAAMAQAILAAAAPNDDDAAASMTRDASANRAWYRELIESLMASTGRAWRTGCSSEGLALVTLALVEGFLHLWRFEPNGPSQGVFADSWLRMFLAVTVEPGAVDADAVDRLAVTMAPASAAFHEGDREKIVAAARKVYARDGWSGLSETSVAAHAGIDRLSVVKMFGDKRGLAAAVWATKVPELERFARLLHGAEDTKKSVAAFLTELVVKTREDLSLSAAFLEGVFATTARIGAPDSDPSDPRVLVPLPTILAPLLAERQHVLDRLGLSAMDAAAMLCNNAMHLSFTRTQWSDARVVHTVSEVLLGGMLSGTSA